MKHHRHTPKRADILLDPVKSQPLIPQADICVTTSSDLVALQEAPSRQPIIEAHSDHWLSQCLRIVDNEGEVVSRI